MKKILFTTLLILLTAFLSYGQTTTDNFTTTDNGNDLSLTMHNVDVAAGATAYSPTFLMTNYNHESHYTNPVYFAYKFDAADTVKSYCYWMVNYIHPDSTNAWIVADTVFSATSATLTKGTANLNGVKAPYNKLKITNGTATLENTFELGIFVPGK